MKQRNPYDRNDLKIKKSDCVLEIGSGHNPTYRANTIVEKYIDSNYHRGGNIKIFSHQKFVNSSGENMPFKDKAFDYSTCCHVLEHVEDPAKFIKELVRVSARGYIEVPSFIGESLFPKESHKWAILELNNKLIFYDKALLPSFYPDFGKLFLNYLPFQSIAYRLFDYTYGNVHTVRYEWKDNIEYLINPADEYYRSFFYSSWTLEMSQTIFPKRSKGQELCALLKAAGYLIYSMLRNKLNHHNLLSIEEYNKMNKK